jgi:glycosyltransferase involved in cell wall biosynthesis
MPLLSVIVPAYNEADSISQILERINAVSLDKEIIVVDDGSYDGTDKTLRSIRYDNFKVIHHTTNRGKGAAFLTGLSQAKGDYIIIQDADLEYDPQDYFKLLEAVRLGKADIGIGARFLGTRKGLFMHWLGNKLITGILNFLFASHLNDYSSCYKLAARDTWLAFSLRASRFDIEAEIVCNALKMKKRILDVPVSYYPRSYRQGKKIRWMDGLRAIIYIFKYRFVS